MRALITGAHGDIGFALVNYLLDAKYHVVALDKNLERLNALNHRQLTTKQIDFSDTDGLSSKLRNLDQEFDILIYAAGTREIESIFNLSLAKWQEVQDINLTSAFLLTQHVAKLAIKSNRPLCIIYISSISGIAGEPKRGAYCASKHGLIGLAKSLAIELAEHSIRINVIAPGIINTDLTKPYQNNPNIMKQLNINIPLGRWGEPHHIVQTTDFIIKNDYLTGSTIVIDGGWTAGKKI